jgi:hypothetical protein
MKKIYYLIITILTLILTPLQAQNLPTIDFKRWHYGAFVGVNVMDLGIKEAENTQLHPEIKTWIPGFSVGLIGEMRLNNYFGLRLAPAFHMGQYNVVFDTIKASQNYRNVPSQIIRIPVYIKYSALRFYDCKPYVLAGGGIDIEWNIDKDPENPILFKQLDYFTEFGVGCTFYTEYLRFSIEAKYSLGFNNKFVNFEEREGTPHEPLILDRENINRAAQTQSIQSLKARVFSLVLNINI